MLASWLDQDQLAFSWTDVRVSIAPVAILLQNVASVPTFAVFVLCPSRPWSVLQGMGAEINQLWRGENSAPIFHGASTDSPQRAINASIGLDTSHRDHVPRRRQLESFLCWVGRLGRCAKRNSSQHQQTALQQLDLVHVLCTTSTPSSLLRSVPWSDSWKRSKPSGALCRSSDKLIVPSSAL